MYLPNIYFSDTFVYSVYVSSTPFDPVRILCMLTDDGQVESVSLHNDSWGTCFKVTHNEAVNNAR